MNERVKYLPYLPEPDFSSDSWLGVNTPISRLMAITITESLDNAPNWFLGMPLALLFCPIFLPLT